jgi:hypothetical protein
MLLTDYNVYFECINFTFLASFLKHVHSAPITPLSSSIAQVLKANTPL